MALRDSKRGTLTALRLALRPLVKLAMRSSLKLMDLFELLKVVFVDVATEELDAHGDTPSASRISVMSGVHRRDTTRIMRSDEPVREPQDLIGKVIGQWNSDPRFSTKAGKPKVLSAEGMESEFAQLVQSITVDVAPYTVLYEMERTGRLERTANGVKLRTQLFLAAKGDVQLGFSMLGEDLADLICAVEGNVFDGSAAKNLHLKTEFTGIDPKSLPEIRKWLLVEGTAFHRRVEQFLSAHDCDVHPERKRAPNPVRVAFGSFSFVENSAKKRGTRS